jgi:hypothetical protein
VCGEGVGGCSNCAEAPQKPNEVVAADPKVSARSPVTTGVDGLRLPDELTVEASTSGWSEM